MYSPLNKIWLENAGNYLAGGAEKADHEKGVWFTNSVEREN